MGDEPTSYQRVAGGPCIWCCCPPTPACPPKAVAGTCECECHDGSPVIGGKPRGDRA